MRKIHTVIMGILLLLSITALAQTKEVTGKITDPSGTPIPAATIKIRGSKGGVSADGTGAFKLNAPPRAILIISAIGYETAEISIADRNTVDISLKASNSALVKWLSPH